jgi:hypothetical protein
MNPTSSFAEAVTPPYTDITCYTLHPDHPAIDPVLCLLRNLTPDLFPLQDINSVHLATESLLNSCL